MRSDLRVVLGKLLCFLRPGFCHHDVMWVNTDGFSVELVSWALKVGTAHCCETSVSTDSSTLNQNSKTVWRVKCALSFYSTEWATKKYPVYRFARVLVIFSLALVCILRRVSEQLVKNRAVTVLRYTRCNIVILMTASAWLMLSSSSSIVCGSDSYTVLFMCPQRKFLGGGGFSLGTHEKYGIWIKSAHDTGTGRHQLRSCSHQIRTRYRNWKTTSATEMQPSQSLCYIRYTSTWLDVSSCVLMQEATTCNIFYDGITFQHLATVLISVFTLCCGPGLLFRGPSCTLQSR